MTLAGGQGQMGMMMPQRADNEEEDGFGPLRSGDRKETGASVEPGNKDTMDMGETDGIKAEADKNESGKNTKSNLPPDATGKKGPNEEGGMDTREPVEMISNEEALEIKKETDNEG